MRSRIAIAALLASGALMSGGGAALGVSALSAPTGASEAQYGPDDGVVVSTETSGKSSERDATGSQVLGDNFTVTAKPGTATKGSKGVKSATDELAETPEAKVQAPRQIEAGGRDALPFTGYVSIPLLLVGLLLLATGLVIRRNTRRDRD